MEFDDGLRTPEIEAASKVLEERIRAAHPQVLAIFIKPQTAHDAAARLAERRAGITTDV